MPILVEDFPSEGSSPRNVCLDAVDSCDGCVILVGERAGYRTPSGAFVVEEEYLRARQRKIPILVFLQDVHRDSDAQRIADTLSDYVDGHLRQTFGTASDLRNKLAPALRRTLSVPTRGRKLSLDEFEVALRHVELGHHSPTIRMILFPERCEEVVDPVHLGQPDFVQGVLEVGHSRAVGLFAYANRTRPLCKPEALVVEEERDHGVIGKRVEIGANGRIYVDAVVVGDAHGEDPLAGMVVLRRDMHSTLERAFKFGGALYDRIDPHKRHQRFHLGASLHHLEFRSIVTDRPRRSVSMNMSGDAGPILAFPEPRLVGRADFQSSGEVDRLVEMIARRSAGRR